MEPPPRFILFIQKNWQGAPLPTGDKMAAYVYNQIPDTHKVMFRVVYVTAENIG